MGPSPSKHTELEHYRTLTSSRGRDIILQLCKAAGRTGAAALRRELHDAV
jgi:hypothetical protein